MNTLSSVVTVVLAVTSVLTTCALAKEYKQGDKVDLWAYSVFPANNPQERYPYSSAGLCGNSYDAADVETKDLSLGEVLAGYRYEKLSQPVKYLEPAEFAAECTELLAPAKLRHLERLVREGYWYEWLVDGLPAWAPVGAVVNGRAYLYTHRYLNISHDAAGHITAATLDVSDARALEDYAVPEDREAQIPLAMTYSVGWTAASTDYEYRRDRYLDMARFGGLPRFLGTLFALILAFFVVCVSLTSYANTTGADSAGKGRGDDRRTQALCAAAGLGIQLMFAAAGTACAGLFGAKFIAPGELAARFALLYALGGVVGGYAGTRAYCALEGPGSRRWLRVPLLGMCGALPLAAYGAWTFVNAVGAWCGSLVAAPFRTQATVALCHVFAVTPLTLLGAFLARRRFVRDKGQQKKAVTLGHNHIQAAGAPGTWKNRVVMAGGWALEYFCVAVELHYAAVGVWEYAVFMGYGYTLFSLLALCCCAGKMGVTTAVFMWNNGSAAWRRNAFVSGAGVGVPVLLHFAVYYVRRSAMSGFLQFVAFFSVAGAISVALALSCGSIALVCMINYIENLDTSDKKE